MDVETDGPFHNLLSFGLVAFDSTGKELDTFSAVLKPVVTGAPATIEWLKKQQIGDDTNVLNAYINATKNGEEPADVMERATCWCMDLILKHECTTGYLVCFPSAFDGHFWTTYCHRYNVKGYENFMKRFPNARKDPDALNYRDPFGFNHIDGQTFAMGKKGSDTRLNLKQLRSLHFTSDEIKEFEKHAHDATHDARNQGQLFFRIVAGSESKL